MSTITEADMNKLLEEEKAYLGITWKDETTDTLLRSYIKTSIKRLESIFGADLNFIDGEEAYDHLGHELLITRVFYAREKALDDFDSNFRGELLTLRNYGKVKQLMARKEGSEDANE